METGQACHAELSVGYQKDLILLIARKTERSNAVHISGRTAAGGAKNQGCHAVRSERSQSWNSNT